MKKILLLCSAGMSTSMIVQKMEKVVKERGVEIEIKAVSASEFHTLIDSYDIFLLGPQIKYQQAELGKLAKEKNKPLGVIDFKDYGMMDGAKILDFALSLTME